MKNNDLNLLILQELIRIANEVFARMVIKFGTYTAAELAKLKDGKGNDITISFAEPDKIYHIEVGSFKCSFPENRIFYLVWQFESECGIKQKDKARFTRVEEKEVVCEFKMQITKEQTKIAKMVGNDPCRPVMNYIHIDHYNSALIATNGRIMKEYKVDIESVDIPEGLNLYIEPKHIKELVGSCSVCVRKDGDKTITEITNEQGKVFVCDYSDKYPNYRSVYPKLSKDGYIKVRKNELKSVSSFVKSVKKNKYNDTFTLETISGERKMYLSYEDIDFAQSKEIIIELEEPAKIDIRLGLKAVEVLPMLSGWTGGLWLVSPCNSVVFDDKEAVAGIVMPACIDNAIYPKKMELNINAYERFEALSEAKEKKENNLPALYVASGNDVVAFVSALSDAIKSISDTFYKGQIKEALERLKKLSELSGIPMEEIISETECKEIKEEPSWRIEEVMQPEVLPEAYKGIEKIPNYSGIVFPFPRLLRCMDAHTAQPYRKVHIGSICNVMLSIHCLRRYSAKFSSVTVGFPIAHCRRLRKKGNHRIRDGTIKNDRRIMIEIINNELNYRRE